jgi:Tryptophan/tyrosine permease family
VRSDTWYHTHLATLTSMTFASLCTLPHNTTHTNRTAIIGGSAVPLLMFLAWNTVVLGSVDSAVVASATSSSGTFDPVQSLQGVGDYAAQLPQIVSVFSEVRNWLLSSQNWLDCKACSIACRTCVLTTSCCVCGQTAYTCVYELLLQL